MLSLISKEKTALAFQKVGGNSWFLRGDGNDV